MSKKILFMSSAKLTAISIGLLLAVFCTIGMSFTPGEEGDNVGNPNDSTYVPGPRRSHWTTSRSETSSGCNPKTTYYYIQHNTTDYGKATAHVSAGNGTVTVSYEFVENGSYKATIDNSHTALGPSSSEAYVTWSSATTGTGNSSESESDTKTYTAQQLAASHSLKVTFTASPAEGYRFLGWSTSGSSNDNYKSQDDPSFTETIVIGDGGTGFGSYGTSENTTYNSYSKAYPKTYYAYFEEIPKVNVTFLPPSTALVDKGNYDVTIGDVTTNVSTVNVEKQVDAAVTLTMHPKNPYMFVRWYSQEGETKTTLSTNEEYTTTFGATATIGAELQEMPTHLNMTFKAVELDANDEPVGSYKVNSQTVTTSDFVYNTGDDISFKPTLVATPTSKYVFYGWYTKDGAKKNYLSYDATWTPTLMEDITIYADFLYSNYSNDELAQFKVGSTTYFDLNAANSAASSGSNKTITLVKDGILPPGHYTISSANTLLIPYDANGTMVTSESNFKNMANQTFAAVSAYKTLTFAKGADLTVDGTLYVAAQHFSSTNVMTDGAGGPGRPIGPVGRIHMADGGHIEVNGKLFCFGFITGQNMADGNNTLDVGTITANSGATVYENFIVGDMRGGDATYAMTDDATYKAFPFNGYYLQNIEVPIQFNHGAIEKCVVSFNPSSTNATATFTIIGGSSDDAMFRLNAAGATITKWYDATTDHFCVKMSGNSSLKNLKLSFTMSVAIFSYPVNINSQDYILPIPSSMHLIFDNTTLTLSNELCLLPGAIAEIRENASISLGTNLYLYDVSQWDKYCVDKYYTTYNTPFTTHLVRKTSDMSQLEDAKMIVDGTLTVNSGKYVYSTSSGANICGNGDGKLVYAGAIPSSSTNVYQVYGSATGTNTSSSYTLSGIKCTVYLTQISMGAANLHNENNTYTKSIGSTTFHNVHGRWFAGSAKDENASTHVHTFTYLDNGNAGSSVNTPAVYSWDKTGLELQQKWADVTGPVCDTWWAGKGTQASYFYNWSLSSDWHQFLPMASPQGWYSGSNNKLYIKTDCDWEEIGEADENCLYTHEGVKKALVEGVLIELEKNEYDQAYHDKATGENFYICFEGCNWHPAMPYPEEQEAYIVNEENFIWKDGEWFNVLRDELFFYTLNEKGIKDYYDYIDGRWQDALPLVKVTSGDQVWRGYTLLWAVSKANEVNDAVITILNNIKGENNEIIYNRANTTCTLDLNGHTVSGACAKLLTINAAGSTFTITDNSEEKNGRLESVFNQNATTYNVTVTSGTLNLNAGTIYVENPAQYAAKVNAATGITAVLTSCGARGIQVAAAQKLNVTGGRVESHATRNAYGIVAAGNAANTTLVTVSGGTIYAEAPYGAYGINCSGKLHVSGGTITGHLNTAWADGQYTQGSNSDRNCHQYAYGINMTASSNATASSCYYGTLTMTGGTVQATSAWDASYTCYAYGVRIQKALTAVADASKTADGTHSQKASAIGSITGGTISVDIKGNYAYGVFVEGNYNSYNKTSNTFHISGATITSKAKNYAYGVYANASIDGTCGGYHYGIVELDNSTVTARTTAAYAYAVYVASTSSTIFQDKQANYYGEYATAAEMTINSGTYTAVAGSSTAYAATSSTRSKTTYGSETSVVAERTRGGNAEAYAKLAIHGGTFRGEATTTTSRAVSSGGITTIDGGTFEAYSTSTTAYGLYAVSGKLTATGVTVTASATGTAYGAFADCAIPSGNTAQTGFAYAGELELNNCNITATTRTSTEARGVFVNATNKLHNWTQFKADSTAYTSTWAANTNNYAAIYRRVFPCTIEGRDSVGIAIAGKATINGGTITATAATNTAYGVYSVNSFSANLDSIATPDLVVRNATITAKTNGTTTAYGIYAQGETTIDGCDITVQPKTTTGYGIMALNYQDTVRVSNTTVRVTTTHPTSSTSDATAYGIYGYVDINATNGLERHGNFILGEGNDVTSTITSGKTSYAVFLNATKRAITTTGGAYRPGDYATAATAIINGGEYNATATSGAYALVMQGKQTQGSVTAAPQVTVNGGKFNGKTAETGTGGLVGYEQLLGGYYVHNTNLAKYAVAPKSVWTLPTTHEEYANGYRYKIAEIYTITFKNGSAQLQSGIMEAGTTPSYSGTPTKTADAQYTYTFDGWSETEGGDKLASLPVVSEDATYFAHYTYTVNNYTVSIAANNAVWGTVSSASVAEVPYGSAVTVSGNKITVNGTTITATPAEKTAQYTYAFDHWENVPETVTGNVANIQAVFTRTLRSYTVIWDNYGGQTLETDDDVLYGTTPEYNGETPTLEDPEFEYTFTGWTPDIASVTGDVTYTATYSSVKKKYTITWKDMALATPDHVIKTEEYEWHDMPSFNYQKPSDESYSYVFLRWSPEVTLVEGDTTYVAQYNAVPKNMIVEDDETIPGNVEVVTTTVKVSGHLTINEGAQLTTNDLILEASGTGSGDINGADRVQLRDGGKAYFDYTFDVDPWHWSAFGVPFEIDLNAAAPLKETTTPMVLGSDYDIVYYDSDERAAHGPSSKCWKYVEYDAERKLTPGKLYMIAFNRHVGHVNVVRFTKAAEAAIDFTANVALATDGTGNDNDNNWNGIANPRMYHALLDAGVTECQVHDGGEIGKDGYHTYIMQGNKFFVGKAAFVQVPNEQSVMTTTQATNQSAIVVKAPRRAKAQEGADRYDVQIAPMTEEMSDRVFLLTDEDKADEYVIVSDLAKAGVSPVRPQMWVNRYGVKLCKNTVAMRENIADYPLGISVPADGSYDIFLEERPNNNDMLYLTYDGEAIWNLSYGACTIDLQRGTTDHYGLRVVAKTPQVATGIEETTIQNGDAVRKVIVEDKVFIIRNGQIFGIDGRLAK